MCGNRGGMGGNQSDLHVRLLSAAVGYACSPQSDGMMVWESASDCARMRARQDEPGWATAWIAEREKADKGRRTAITPLNRGKNTKSARQIPLAKARCERTKAKVCLRLRHPTSAILPDQTGGDKPWQPSVVSTSRKQRAEFSTLPDRRCLRCGRR